MRFLRHPLQKVPRFAVFSGAFHPPTVAHTALAAAARAAGREILWVLPQQFPHKKYEQVTLESRLEMILALGSDAVAVVENGLYFDMAAEVSSAVPGCSVEILLGEDAARRIIEWDYGIGEQAKAAYLAERLARFPLLTAARERSWQPPESYASYLTWLPLDAHFQAVSSTEVRERMANGAPWDHLVPEPIHTHVQQLYGSTGNSSGQ